VKRVGSDETRVVDVRFLAATNLDLRTRIETGAFRPDLYYRLNVIPIHIPPLRSRGNDVLMLAHHFLTKLARRMQRPPKRLHADTIRALQNHAWPGNVRELEHALEHAVVLARGDVVHPGDLPFMRRSSSREMPAIIVPAAPRVAGLPVPAPAPIEAPPPASAPFISQELLELPYADAKRRAMALFDEAYVVDAMRRAAGNAAEAARLAGLDRSNFRRIARKGRVD
jgi:transcriptional regulator with GAF, ATPase, and Fis domain